MKAVVIDTNVAVVANGRAKQADWDCVLACLDALDGVRRSLVVLNDKNRILDEYRKHLSARGQPGARNESQALRPLASLAHFGNIFHKGRAPSVALMFNAILGRRRSDMPPRCGFSYLVRIAAPYRENDVPNRHEDSPARIIEVR